MTKFKIFQNESRTSGSEWNKENNKFWKYLLLFSSKTVPSFLISKTLKNGVRRRKFCDLSFIIHGCETWSVTMSTEVRKMSESKMNERNEHLRSLRKDERRLELVNVKVKLSLILTKHHAIKAYWGSEGITPLILWPLH
jgi:hypothetical protein